jgi:hypothetical protein
VAGVVLEEEVAVVVSVEYIAPSEAVVMGKVVFLLHAAVDRSHDIDAVTVANDRDLTFDLVVGDRLQTGAFALPLVDVACDNRSVAGAAPSSLKDMRSVAVETQMVEASCMDYGSVGQLVAVVAVKNDFAVAAVVVAAAAAVSFSSVFGVDRRAAFVDSSWSDFEVLAWHSWAIVSCLQHAVARLEQVIQNWPYCQSSESGLDVGCLLGWEGHSYDCC